MNDNTEPDFRHLVIKIFKDSNISYPNACLLVNEYLQDDNQLADYLEVVVTNSRYMKNTYLIKRKVK